MIVAVAVIAAGSFVVYEAATGPGNPGYAEVGPGVIPGVIGVALALAGLALLLQALRGEWQVIWFEREVVADAPDMPSDHSRERISMPFINVFLVAAALILDVALMAPFGFVVAAAVLFTLVAAAFGSRRFVLDAALGLAFGGVIHLIFVHGLGLHLPVGDLWGSLPWIS